MSVLVRCTVFAFFGVVAFLVVAPTPAVGAQQDAGEGVSPDTALRDWRDVLEMAARADGLPGTREQGERDLSKPDQIKDYNSLQTFIDEDFDDMVALLDRLREGYGQSVTDISRGIREACGISWQDTESTPDGIPSEPQLGRSLDILMRSQRWMPIVVEETVERNIVLIRRAIDNSGFRSEDAMVPELERIAAWIEQLRRIAPDRPEGEELAERVDELTRARMAQVKRAVADRRMPERYAGFEGPGDPEQLENEARRLLAKLSSWTDGGQEVLQVRIAGDWFVAERNILDQVTRRGVPMRVAITNDEMRPQGLAKLYAVHLLTERSAGVAAEPPFRAVQVVMALDNPSLMLLANVPGQQGAARVTPEPSDVERNPGAREREQGQSDDAGETASPTGPKDGGAHDGGVGMLGVLGSAVSLLLIVANIIAGVTLLSPPISSALPQARTLLARFGDNRPSIGALAAVAAALAAALSLGTLAPLSAIFPIATLVAAAYVLFALQRSDASARFSSDNERIGPTEADPITPEDGTMHNAALVKYKQHLGAACVAAGLLHFFAGSVVIL